MNVHLAILGTETEKRKMFAKVRQIKLFGLKFRAFACDRLVAVSTRSAYVCGLYDNRWGFVNQVSTHLSASVRESQNVFHICFSYPHRRMTGVNTQ